MENNVKSSSTSVDYGKVSKLIWKRKWLFLIVVILTAALSSLIILQVPRYYESTVVLAPETDSGNKLGSLSSMAASLFGSEMSVTNDAIQPISYPDLIKSNDFLTSLFPLKVSTNDGKLKDINYYTYLKKHQESACWDEMMSKVKMKFSKDKPSPYFNGESSVNSFKLSKDQNDIASLISRNIKCNVDKKTNVITINVTDQDPLVCAMIADSIRGKLQVFITEYRTKKARIDYNFYKKLTADAEKDYERARQKYARFSDANIDLELPSLRTEQEDLENDMQLKYNNYTMMHSQLQMAMAKVQERTPVFTVLQCSSVPLKPAGPKRVIFVLGMTFIAFCITLAFVMRKIVQ